MSANPKNFSNISRYIFYGNDTPLPEGRDLRAGPLTMRYENGDLRYIRFGQHEVLRRIYIAIRDRNWGTILPVFSNVQLDVRADSFDIQYDVENRERDVDFRWHGHISGTASGTLTFGMDGAAHSSFMKNRIGFCVLHPASCAGVAARITHIDGTQEAAHLPVYIGPQLIRDGIIQPLYPFADMAALSHEAAPGIWAHVTFAGDTFEMEDQRNWIDASFKTYCTPLRLPWPAPIKSGTKISQAITINVEGSLSDLAANPISRNETVTLAPTNDNPRTLPRIGLASASHGEPLSTTALQRLAALHLAHLRVDLRLQNAGYEVALRRAWSEASAINCALEVAVFVSDAAAEELVALRTLIDQLKPKISQWLIFHIAEKTTSERWITLARQLLFRLDEGVLLGGGTNVFFTELNSQKPPAHLLDLVSYSINPQVHAVDDASMIETLATIPMTIESAHQFSANAQIAISPVTFKQRFNPVATSETPLAPDELPPQVDQRQMSLFGAGWTLGCLKVVAESGLDSITLFETTGWRGVMETDSESPLPAQFHSLPGMVFPMYHVLADIGKFAGGEVIPYQSSAPLQVNALALQKEGRICWLIANYTAVPQTVQIGGLNPTVKLHPLDETTVEMACMSPEQFRATLGEAVVTSSGTLKLTLRPFAVVRID